LPGVTISARNVAKVILTATAVIAGLYVLWLIRYVIALFFMSVFLAVALGPAVAFFQRRLRLNRAMGIVATYLSLLLVVVAVGFLVVPPIVEQTAKFVENVPEYVADLGDNKTVRDIDNRYDITPTLQREAQKLPARFGDAASTLQDLVIGLFNAVITIVTVLVMTFFLLLDGNKLFEWVVRELGPARGPRVRAIAEEVYESVGGYVTGNLTISVIAGVTTYLVLTVLGVPFAVPLAVLMSFLDLIPLIGASIAGFVIGIVAALGGDFPQDLILWVVFLVVYQQIENNMLQPLIYRRTVALHPLLVIVAILIGSALLGILGALLAIPIAGAIQIVVKDWWRVRKTGPSVLGPAPAVALAGDVSETPGSGPSAPG
jgi:predicted PurR-regulated permease PerM